MSRLTELVKVALELEEGLAAHRDRAAEVRAKIRYERARIAKTDPSYLQVLTWVAIPRQTVVGVVSTYIEAAQNWSHPNAYLLVALFEPDYHDRFLIDDGVELFFNDGTISIQTRNADQMFEFIRKANLRLYAPAFEKRLAELHAHLALLESLMTDMEGSEQFSLIRRSYILPKNASFEERIESAEIMEEQGRAEILRRNRDVRNEWMSESW